MNRAERRRRIKEHKKSSGKAKPVADDKLKSKPIFLAYPTPAFLEFNAY